MAAITTLDAFAGSDDGVITGWTNVLGTNWEVTDGVPGNMVEYDGAAWPKDRLADAAMVSDTTFTEVFNGTTSRGYCARMTLGGGDSRELYEPNQKISMLYDYEDDSNYRRVQVEIAAIKIGDGSYHDEVTLWKMVAGTETEVGAGTTLKMHQQEPGDLRHYYVKKGTTISITKIDDQHFVRMSVFDRHGRHDQADLLVRHEGESTGAPVARKVGVWFHGGRHRFAIDSFQAQLMDVKFQDPAGSDSNSGVKAFPYATYNKLVENVTANMFGIIEAGTTRGYISTLDITLPQGTSHEDCPFITARAGETPIHLSGGFFGNLYLRPNAGGTQPRYTTFNGWDMDGDNTDATYKGQNCIKFGANAGAGSNVHPIHIRVSNMIIRKAVEGANVLLSSVDPDDPGASGDGDLATWTHFTDCDIYDGDSFGGGGPNSCHGLYHASGRYNCFEFLELHDNEGNGGKTAFGTAGYATAADGTSFRYSYTHDNPLFGYYMRGGQDMEMAYNRSEDNATSSGNSCAGLSVWGYNAGAIAIHHNTVLRCGVSGTENGGISVMNKFGQTSSGPVSIFYNTVFDCAGYGINVDSSATGITTNVAIADNVVHDSGTADIFIDANSTGPTVISTNNHVTADGDPKFVNEGVGVEDFNLQSDSPLIAAGTVRTEAKYAYALDGKKFLQGGKMAQGAYNFEYVGKHYFVNHATGNNANTGLGRGTGLAWQTVEHAMETVEPGDTINIEGGVQPVKANASSYTFKSGTSWDAPIIIQPDGTAGVTMNAGSGGGTHCFHLAGDGPGGALTYIKIQAGAGTLTIDCADIGSGALHGGLKVFLGSHHIRLDGVEIANSYNSAVLAQNNGAEDSTYVELLNMTIRDSGSVVYSHGVHLSASDNLIRNCVIYNSSGYGAYLFDTGVLSHFNMVELSEFHDNGLSVSKQSAGIALGGGHSHVARNNIIRDDESGIHVFDGEAQRGNFALHNTIYNVEDWGILAHNLTGHQAKYARIRGNLVWVVAGTPYQDVGFQTDEFDNLWNTIDPLFENTTPGQLDFQLQSTSPARDGAEVLPSLTADYIGTTRPQGAFYDIGAYEFPNPIPGTFEIDMPATHAGVVNFDVPISVQVSDAGSRGRVAFLRATVGNLTATAIGTTVKTGGA